jgi:hypothetical protein
VTFDDERLSAAILGLARNPSIGAEVLHRLAGSDDEQVLRALAGRPDLSEDFALALATRRPRLRVYLAGNFPVAMRIWRLLAADPSPSVRATLAGGRGGTIVDPGHEMGRKPDPPLPDEVGRTMIADSDPKVRRAMAKRDQHTEEMFRLLAADPSPECREALAVRWKGAPPEVLRDWFSDPKVLPWAMWHHVPPDDLVPVLLTNREPHIRAQVAQQGRLDHDTAAACARSDDPRMRQAVARNRRAPLAAVLPLADDPDPEVRLALAYRPDLPEALRDDITREIDLTWNRYVADWLLPDAAPLATRLEHIGSAAPFVRRAIARSTDLPDDAAARLFDDPDPTVRAEMAEHHPNTPPDVLFSLSRTSMIDAFRLTPHPNFPAQHVEWFAHGGESWQRVVAAIHPRLPAGTAESLANDPRTDVRRGVAANPAAPVAVIERLLSDDDPYIVMEAAANPALPATVAHDLVRAAQDNGLLPG